MHSFAVEFLRCHHEVWCFHRLCALQLPKSACSENLTFSHFLVRFSDAGGPKAPSSQHRDFWHRFRISFFSAECDEVTRKPKQGNRLIRHWCPWKSTTSDKACHSFHQDQSYQWWGRKQSIVLCVSSWIFHWWPLTTGCVRSTSRHIRVRLALVQTCTLLVSWRRICFGPKDQRRSQRCIT